LKRKRVFGGWKTQKVTVSGADRRSVLVNQECSRQYPHPMNDISSDVCRNCGAHLTGKFCQECGQKRFVESDRRLGHLAHEFLANATDLDSRIWRTLRALLFQPGLLSHEYMEGRRARWISPISLFLAVCVIYFVAPLHGSDVSLQFNSQVTARVRQLAAGPDEKLSDAQRASEGQAHSKFTSPLIDERVRERDATARAESKGANGYSYRDYRLAYNAKADDISKALVILHMPFVALVLMVIFVRKHRYFAEHFVVALHFFAFTLLTLQIVVQGSVLWDFLVPTSWALPGSAMDWFMRAAICAYTVAALRRAYGVGWGSATVAATVMLAAVVAINIYIYRAIQFLVTFALT
jgi:hypothetical protein